MECALYVHDDHRRTTRLGPSLVRFALIIHINTLNFCGVHVWQAKLLCGEKIAEKKYDYLQEISVASCVSAPMELADEPSAWKLVKSDEILDNGPCELIGIYGTKFPRLSCAGLPGMVVSCYN